MKKIYIWGTGNFGSIIFEALNRSKCEVLGCIDNNLEKRNTRWYNLKIFAPEDIIKKEYDYILITTFQYSDIVTQCKKMGIYENRLIVFWDTKTQYDFINYSQIIIAINDFRRNQIYDLNVHIIHLEMQIKELPYEIQKNHIKIHSAETLLKKIILNKYSLCRFGDGEFEIMRGKERAWFQKTNEILKERLNEVFRTQKDDLLIAIADNFGRLDKYTEDAAFAIRDYLQGDTRTELIDMIGCEREYYDAYVSRPYNMYKDKNNAKVIFGLFKKLWCDRNILLVEGEYIRTGVGNDLFSTANTIRRIICPAENAFDRYNEILETVLQNTVEDDLVLICLGPTATVLAYDVCSKGFQAIDLGQVDNEYEWFLAGVEKRVPILGKAVPELLENSAEECKDKGYVEQIVARIGCLE